MLEKINDLHKQIENLSAETVSDVEALRIKYLSKKGEISALMNDFRTVPAEQKRELGQALNSLKDFATARIAELREQVEAGSDSGERLDVTRDAAPVRLGTRHPLNLVREQIIDIFRRLGFTIAEGPEIEDDWLVLILRRTIQRAICRIRSLYTAILMCFFAPIHRAYRPAL